MYKILITNVMFLVTYWSCDVPPVLFWSKISTASPNRKNNLTKYSRAREFGHLERHAAGLDRRPAFIMAGTVGPAPAGALVPGGARGLVRPGCFASIFFSSFSSIFPQCEQMIFPRIGGIIEAVTE